MHTEVYTPNEEKEVKPNLAAPTSKVEISKATSEQAVLPTNSVAVMAQEKEEYKKRIIRNNMRKKIFVSTDPNENYQIKLIRAKNRVIRLTLGNSYIKKILINKKIEDRAKIWALFFTFDKFKMKRSNKNFVQALQSIAVRKSLNIASRKLLSCGSTEGEADNDNEVSNA